MAQSPSAKAFGSLAAIPLGGCTNSKWRPETLALANAAVKRVKNDSLAPCSDFQEIFLVFVCCCRCRRLTDSRALSCHTRMHDMIEALLEVLWVACV
jgi:hypothetical protein